MMPTSVEVVKENQDNVMFWFKSDLRLDDNRGLEAAIKKLEANSAKGIQSNLFCSFILLPKEYKCHDMSAIKFNFIIGHLHKLQAQLSNLNIPFYVDILKEDERLETKLLDFCKKYQISSLFYNIEYEFNENKRDNKVSNHLTSSGIEVKGYHDQCVLEPGSVVAKSTQKPYTVFTPFKDTYLHKVAVESQHLRLSDSIPKKQEETLKTTYPKLFRINLDINHKELGFELDTKQTKDLEFRFPVGSEEAIRRLDTFIETKLADYKKARDFPDLEGTSQLSPYLTVGSISLRVCMKKVQKANNDLLSSGDVNKTTYIIELVWRDFYRHILFNFIHVSKSLPFKLETKDLSWHYDENKFKAWCEGKTGYPIVDAGMRQLNTIGWMHNRLRMVTATFLTKDLLINWQHGEKYFMSKLIDGDLASNNGGWQWSASTGTDAQPYFRIFNPKLQSEKFDKEGNFIAKYVPELKSLKGTKEIHEPFKMLEKSKFEKLGYPKPIVDHSKARILAIETYAKIMKKAKV